MTLNKDGLEAALLPCPFCGGPTRRIEYNGTDQATCAGGHAECQHLEIDFDGDTPFVRSDSLDTAIRAALSAHGEK